MEIKTQIERSALLVIDAQDSFKVGPRWLRRNNFDFEKNVAALVEGFRAKKLPIYFFLDWDDTEHFEPRSPHFKLMDFLQPANNEPVLIKTSRNCFTTTNLDYLLRRSDVKRIVVAGIKTEQCCETTTRVASDLGYEVDFVTEATLTFPIPHRELQEELAVEEVVKRTEYALHNRFARINTVAGLLAELGGDNSRATPRVRPAAAG